MNTEMIEIQKLPSLIKEKSELVTVENKNLLVKKIIKSIKFNQNKILYTISQLPALKNALQVEKGLTAVIPDEYKKKIADKTLKLMSGKDGSIISTIVDAKTGKVVHQLRVEEFTKLANPAMMSQLANQAFVQMQLEEIKKELVDFRVETTAKLNEIIEYLHDDRMLVAETVFENFKRYQNGEVGKENLLIKIDEANVTLLKEIEKQVNYLKDLANKNEINDDESEKIQHRIANVLESIQNFQKIYLIELYLNKDSTERMNSIVKRYSELFSHRLTEKDIKLLQSYSDFEYLGLETDVWFDSILPFKCSLENKTKMLELMEV